MEMLDGMKATMADSMPPMLEEMLAAIAAMKTDIAAMQSRMDSMQETLDSMSMEDAAESAVGKAMEKIRIPADGKSITVEDVRPLIMETVKAEMPEPQEGQAGKSVTPEDVRPMIVDMIKENMPRTEMMEAAILKELVKSIPEPKQGDPGTSITPEDVRPMLMEMVKSLPTPPAGKDGPTADEVAQVLNGRFSEWALGFERKADDLFQRAIDRMPKPKDGKDGRDAFELKDIVLETPDEGRTIVFGFKNDVASVQRDLTTGVSIYRGVYKDGETYQRGDETTWGGSTWIAVRETTSKPETDDSWKLKTKRGRDGKDGINGKDKTKGVNLETR